jgi:hypothetical protein
MKQLINIITIDSIYMEKLSKLYSMDEEFKQKSINIIIDEDFKQ